MASCVRGLGRSGVEQAIRGHILADDDMGLGIKTTSVLSLVIAAGVRAHGEMRFGMFKYRLISTYSFFQAQDLWLLAVMTCADSSH